MSIRISRSKRRIVAADEDFNFGEGGVTDEFPSGDMMGDGESFDDNLDNMADTIDDMQDQLDEVQEDDVNIDVDNNIANHYIVECDKCQGIFISAMVESDQEVEKISGKCPLCEKDSDQYIKWIVRDINDRDKEI
ncbi:MAG: hypothetical protein IJE78_05740 [Bacteroidaceae bacterium]|nr:hypothetical protein [Bacteroidaceae bacterium]